MVSKISRKLVGSLLAVLVSPTAFGQEPCSVEPSVIVIPECVHDTNGFPWFNSDVTVDLLASGFERRTGKVVWENRIIRQFSKIRTTRGRDAEYNTMLADLTKKCDASLAAFSK